MGQRDATQMSWRRRVVKPRYVGLLVLSIISGCQVVAGLSERSASSELCLHDSDCAATQACLFRTCAERCAADVDCADGRCLDTVNGKACVSAHNATCSATPDCPDGTVCRDAACRRPCGDAAPCRSDQVCSSAGVCVGTDLSHDPAAQGDLGEPGGGGQGSGGSAGSSASGSGGKSGSSGVSGSRSVSGSTGVSGSSGAGGTVNVVTNPKLVIVRVGSNFEAHDDSEKVLASRPAGAGQQLLDSRLSPDSTVIGARLSTDGVVADDLWIVDATGRVLADGVEPGWQVRVSTLSVAPPAVSYDHLVGGQWILDEVWRPGFGIAAAPDASWSVQFHRTRIGEVASIHVGAALSGVTVEPTANILELPTFSPDGGTATCAVTYRTFPSATENAGAGGAASADTPVSAASAIKSKDLVVAIKAGTASTIFQGHAVGGDPLFDFDGVTLSNTNATLTGLRHLVPPSDNPFLPTQGPLALSDLIVSFDGSKETAELMGKMLLYPVGLAPPKHSIAFPLPEGATNGDHATCYLSGDGSMADLRLTPMLNVFYQADAAVDWTFQLAAPNTEWLLSIDGSSSAATTVALPPAPAPGKWVKVDLRKQWLYPNGTATRGAVYFVDFYPAASPLSIQGISFSSN